MEDPEDHQWRTQQSSSTASRPWPRPAATWSSRPTCSTSSPAASSKPARTNATPETATPGSSRDITRARKAADEARQLAVEQLKQVRYFWKQAHWLTERFPEAKLRDVEGLVKLVDINEIEANDWSLTPGRYVGVAPEEVDEDFDFEEALREIHVELEDLNAEAVNWRRRSKRILRSWGYEPSDYRPHQ